ncbi:MAG: hypothetical protein K0R10_95 [Alphaproteobacteria bacterium]|jgi:hypothetical protein|nr:hypothetical protein [Alphaproteobacteria bacterium]
MKKQTDKGAIAKSTPKKNTKSRPEVIADTGRRVSKARDEGGQNPRGTTRDKRDARDRAQTSGYADDTLAGKGKADTVSKKGVDTDKTYGSGKGDAGASAREWDEGGSRTRRGAPRAQEGRKMPDENYGDAKERGAPKLKGGIKTGLSRNDASLRGIRE